MRNRYQKPPALPPNPALLEAYLRYAQPTANERLAEPDLTEALRREGVAALCALARAALAEAGDPNRLGAIPFRLRQFLMRAGLGILTADDPFAALQRFLGQKQRGRGRPAEDHDYRNILITADVAELRANGMPLNAAYEKVEKRPGTPSVKRIEKIYLDHRDDLAVGDELNWRRLKFELRTAGNANDPPETNC